MAGLARYVGQAPLPQVVSVAQIASLWPGPEIETSTGPGPGESHTLTEPEGSASLERRWAAASDTLALALPRSVPHLKRHGDAPYRTASPRGPRADQHRQDASRDRAHARSSERHDRLSATPPGSGKLRSRRQVARRARGRADYGGGKDPAPEPVVFCLYR